MFDLVQKYRRAMQVVLALIAITFATWGIESYTRFAGGRDTVASVNGSDILRREFDEQLRQQQENMRRMFGGQIDPAAFDNPELRRAMLDQMVNERVVATETAKRNLWFDDKRLSEAILSVPEFQVGGKFSEQRFDDVARSQSPPATARQFAERIRQSMSVQQIPGAIAQSAIAPHALVERLAAIEAQQREVSQVPIAAKQYLAQVKIDPAQVKQYYESHLGDFRTPERVRAEYVVLSAENLARQEPVTDDEIKQACYKHYDATDQCERCCWHPCRMEQITFRIEVSHSKICPPWFSK